MEASVHPKHNYHVFIGFHMLTRQHKINAKEMVAELIRHGWVDKGGGAIVVCIHTNVNGIDALGQQPAISEVSK